jgi:hypothetical protein
MFLEGTIKNTFASGTSQQPYKAVEEVGQIVPVCFEGEEGKALRS